jgi:hypothetical protein
MRDHAPFDEAKMFGTPMGVLYVVPYVGLGLYAFIWNQYI